MRIIKYLIQFVIILFSFFLFKLIGPKFASNLSGKIFELIGPFFRSRKIIDSNIRKAIPKINIKDLNRINKRMWNNYGRVFAEYIFIKDFRNGKLSKNIQIDGTEILEDIKSNNKQVVFISGHFSNFELMAMILDKFNIQLTAIYRPLNNIFLNKIMEKIRKKYICKHQIKKGIGGLKNLIKFKKKNFSTALMIDQRVSEGIKSNFFNHPALTTTIPAQLIKKFSVPVIPIYIERVEQINFKITIGKPLTFSKNISIQSITDELNSVLEKMIINKPEYWIWSHNRWK